MFINLRPNNRARRTLTFLILLTLVALPTMPTTRAIHDASSSRDSWSRPEQWVQTEASEATRRRAQNSFGKLGLSFEVNEGQTDSQVSFITRAGGYTLFLSATEAVFVLRTAESKANEAIGQSDDEEKSIASSNVPRSKKSAPRIQSRVLRMRIEDANQRSAVVGEEQLPGIVNYFIGSDPTKWHTNIPTFGQVRYSEIYHGVDLVYYGNQRQLEYDFVVKPGANASQVSLEFEGADSMEIEPATGDLILKLGEQLMRQHKPFVYQEVNGARREIESRYTLKGASRVGFRVGEYDRARPLIIDPVLAYSTYVGGSKFDSGNSIAVDTFGNAYVTGDTGSANFPTGNGIDPTLDGDFDAFVTKLNAAGSALVYSTYLGGSINDFGKSIAVDSSGIAYVTGLTNSVNFPTVNAFDPSFNGGSSDAFVTKLNATGSALVYSTYLGGSAIDNGSGIAVDSPGNAHITGETDSTNFPNANAFDPTFNGGNADVFVTKLNPAGSALVYSTYLGSDSFESANGIAVDSSSNVYVIGDTDSSNFPTVNSIDSTYNGGSSDVFVTKLNAAGSALVYSTYLGGSEGDDGNGIAVDSSGNAYITGDTQSANFPTLNAIDPTFNGGFLDCFVTKLNATGSALVYSSYLGGSVNDSGNGIAADSAGNAYVTGLTDSDNFPTTPDAFQTGPDSNQSMFVSKLGNHLIAGRVLDSSNTGIASINITLGGANSATTATDAAGNFLFLDTTSGGNFVVTPTNPGFTFSPPSVTINELNSNQDLLFVGTLTGATPTPTPTPTPSSTLQFSAASFAVDENAGKFQVIVTRSGDTSQAVAVDYATTDGTANDRGDYTTALGRLRFQPSDTAKSFDIFITDDVFAEGNEIIQITLSNPSSGAQLGGMPTTLLTIVDNETVTGTANPIASTFFFVRQHYVDFLNREPDPSGLAFWSNQITACGTDAACVQRARVNVSAAFFLSIEFQETGYLVHRLYRAAFNRFARYREFLRDSQELGRGVIVGQGAWAAQLEANKQQFTGEFVSRADFLAIYAGLTNEQYVDALNVNTGNSLSQSERNALVAELNGGTESRATVLRKVVEDADFAAREFRPGFVLAEYFGYLRRNPDDAPDMNFDGFNFWLAKLNQFNGDFVQAEMVRAFLLSIEYRARFGS